MRSIQKPKYDQCKFRNISKITVLVGTFCDVRGLSKTKKENKTPRVLDSQSKRTKILMYELVRTFVFAWISTFPAVEAFWGVLCRVCACQMVGTEFSHSHSYNQSELSIPWADTI